MSSILFCTDFTLRAKYGLLSAAYLATFFNKPLIICHVHNANKKETSQNLIEDDVLNKKHAMQKDLLHRSLRNLGELEIWIRKNFKNLETSTDFIESSDVSTSISQIAERRNARIIILSTKLRDNGNIYLGGRTITSIKSACPILIFPIGDEWLAKELDEWTWKLNYIVYATDLNKDGNIIYPDDLLELNKWIQIAKERSTENNNTNENINENTNENTNEILSNEGKGIKILSDIKLGVVHVADSNSDVQLNRFSSQFSFVNEWKVIQGENVSESIMNYSREVNPDLLVLGQKKRGFFGSLFHKSSLKTITTVSSIPVLIFNH